MKEILNVVINAWLLFFSILSLVVFIGVARSKLKFTWGHLLWFVTGAVFVVIPYQAMIYELTINR